MQGQSEQRQQFLVAREALEAGDEESFINLAEGLRDYPLHHYLHYWQLLKSLPEQNPETINEFLTVYSDTPLAWPLRKARLHQLAREERWQDYLALYRNNRHAELRCYYHYAQLMTGKQDAVWRGAEQLWLVGHSQHEACDPLFKAWERVGGITDDLRWRRIKLAMENGHTGLANYLAKPLNDSDREWVTLWRQVKANPEKISSSDRLQKDTELTRLIVLQGLKKMASRSPEMAAELWLKLEPHYAFTPKQRDAIVRSIALNFAFDADVNALEWFERLSHQARDNTVVTWAVRSALRHYRWEQVLAWLGELPEQQRQAPSWQYWQGRAYESLRKNGKAKHHYQNAATTRTYYGFLAADRLNEPYNLDHIPLKVDEQILERLRHHPGLQRAHELYLLQLLDEARREWEYAIRRMNREEQLAAGKLAHEWQWHDRALLTLAKAGYFDDLEIRFPLVYSDKIFRGAASNAIDPAWVFAVARQESALVPDARSRVGALGVMQLMPGTGRKIADQLNTKIESKQHLMLPEINIRFGSYYLRNVLEQFDHNPVLATAAYNAGPHRVRKWYPEQGSLAADIWVETLPFRETRQYLRRVLAYTVFYDHRLERDFIRLTQRMPAIRSQAEIVSRCDDCDPKKSGSDG